MHCESIPIHNPYQKNMISIVLKTFFYHKNRQATFSKKVVQLSSKLRGKSARFPIKSAQVTTSPTFSRMGRASFRSPDLMEPPRIPPVVRVYNLFEVLLSIPAPHRIPAHPSRCQSLQPARSSLVDPRTP